MARLTEALANEVEEGEVARRAETPLHDAMMGLTIGERTVAESAIGEPADHPPPPRQRDRESGGKGGERGPMVLVLDESLQALPWESMPCLRGGVVTRCPSLAYVAAALKRHRHMLRETQVGRAGVILSDASSFGCLVDLRVPFFAVTLPPIGVLRAGGVCGDEGRRWVLRVGPRSKPEPDKSDIGTAAAAVQ